jgi:hypothetical protein
MEAAYLGQVIEYFDPMRQLQTVPESENANGPTKAL